MKQRKYYCELTNGRKFEIHEGDFNIMNERIVKGKTNGWYMQRFELPEGTIHNWLISFKDISAVYSDELPNVDRVIPKEGVRDPNKRKPKQVGEGDPKPKKDDKCTHDWNNPDDWEYVTCIVGGAQRYHKQCNKCGGRSLLIKKREVEVNMEAAGKSIDDVPLVDAKP
jgi:hypothetical protein